MIAFLPLILIPALAWLTARWPGERWGAIERWLGGRMAPLVFGLISALALWWTWGSLKPIEVVHDETAYLLQAAMLATGHLTGPARPLPEFFEQFHVFVTPVLAAKYPLGFALALAPGNWFGLPGLMPVVLTGLSGGLLFALGRKIANPSVALLAWVIWFVEPGSIPFRQLIMSETLTTTLWLAGWWCFLEWRANGRPGWLLAVAGLSAWCVVTRLLTGVAYALPLIGATVVLAVRQQRVRQLWAALAVAVAVLSILLWQNRMVTGSWRDTAWSRYTAVYAPADRYGFGIDSTPPQRQLPPDFQVYAWYLNETRRGFEASHLPTIFMERTGQILHDVWGPMAPVAALLVGLGLAGSGGALALAAGTGLLLVIVYLGYAHPPEWSIYYAEMQPLLALLSALGTGRLVGLIGARIRREPAPALLTERAAPALGLLAVILLATAPMHLGAARQNYRALSEYHRRFRGRVAALPGRTIVFVRYAKNHIFHRSLISNPADLALARSWIVYDRGADNVRLESLAPDRAPYLYFEHGDSLRPWTAADSLTTP